MERKAIPISNTIAISAIATITVAAFFDSGFLNALTPLLIASIPVSAVQPPENALRISQMNAKPAKLPSERPFQHYRKRR